MDSSLNDFIPTGVRKHYKKVPRVSLFILSRADRQNFKITINAGSIVEVQINGNITLLQTFQGFNAISPSEKGLWAI